ncbi:major facilitator superfamily domain-containing protein [Penicillium sp. IBT 16267x]|nr:major facilitator superfamily domain-containing protein [Penicillium sp. IBT 16267x]
MAPDLESQSQPTEENKPENIEAFEVGFEPDDVTNPKNFSTLYKIWLVFQMSILAMTGALGSSIISPESTQIAEYTGISTEVTSLTVALFVLGWAFGPMIWAPISEVYGRRLGMLPAIFVLGLFSIGTATSKNTEAIFLTRFFGGILASAPIRGPTIGPIIGSALTFNHNLGWRWTEYIEAIIAFFLFILCALCLPETYASVLLKQKAQKLRKTIADKRYWHPHEKEKIDVHNVVTKHLARRHWSLVISTLPFLSILVGVICAVILNFANQPRYQRAVKANGGKAVPEARLPPIVVGGVLLSVGLFWFGWTAAPKYPWPSPVVAGGFIAAGFNIVFQQCLNFLVDTYGPFAASAVSANTTLRSILECAMPFAARPMLRTWASDLQLVCWAESRIWRYQFLSCS